MTTFKTLVAAMLITSSIAFAHGEQKPGPHGGEIRMSGAFHTEVKSAANSKLKIYLLDMKFQSPTTQNSTVEVAFEGHKFQKAVCEKQKDYFSCEFSESILNKPGKLHVTAIRNNQKGSMVHYATPLKF